MVKLVPVDFNQDGSPRDGRLYMAAQAYSTAQFGSETNFRQYARTWAVLSVRDEEPEYFEVMGFLATRMAVDFPMFHVTPLTDDKEGMKQVHEARNMMIERGKSYCADAMYLTGGDVFVFVAEAAERYWRGFLKKIGAVKANRYQVRI